MIDNLVTDENIDLASVQLDYDRFRQLSLNPHLSPNEKIGFPNAYRVGFGPQILADIIDKLPGLAAEDERTVLDIGPGCAELPQLILDLCARRRHHVYLMDSGEMLDQINIKECQAVKRPGMFPRDFKAIEDLIGRVDLLICYSVFHYIVVEANPFTFVDRCVELLAPGGRALIGDIPNLSKRRRFFSSETGRRYHAAFTKTDESPLVEHLSPALLKVDDTVLAGMVARAQAIGCDAYIVPQDGSLPMANRRDDLLIVRP